MIFKNFFPFIVHHHPTSPLHQRNHGTTPPELLPNPLHLRHHLVAVLRRLLVGVLHRQVPWDAILKRWERASTSSYNRCWLVLKRRKKNQQSHRWAHFCSHYDGMGNEKRGGILWSNSEWSFRCRLQVGIPFRACYLQCYFQVHPFQVQVQVQNRVLSNLFQDQDGVLRIQVRVWVLNLNFFCSENDLNMTKIKNSWKCFIFIM